MILKSINPYTGELLEEYSEISDQEIESSIIHSSEAGAEWKKTAFQYRKELILKVASQLKGNNEILSQTISFEMGKTIKESRAELEKCALVCEYYAENAEKFLKNESISTGAADSFVRYEPLGIILGIMPWNFPFWQFFRFAAPTLMAGNVILLKHASNVQQCARAIENVFEKAGYPKYIVKNLLISSNRVPAVIAHPLVKAVTLTGSETAGKKVAELAGSAVKKTVLELGGSNSFIVLEDADIEKAVETGIRSRFQNAGQSCIAAKRFLVQEKISKKYMELFLQKVKNMKYGDPFDESNIMGPLSSIQLAEKTYDQVNRSLAAGARLITGGTPQNALFPPTIVTDVRPGMPLFDEEVFGPVASFISFSKVMEAVELANKTNFGLGISLFTNDMSMAECLIPEFEDGSVFINSMVESDPRLPFGGTKNSGYGRELSVHGIREFVNTKTVVINKF